MNIPNQQRWRTFFRVRLLARRFWLKITSDSSLVTLPILGLSQIKGYSPSSKASEHFCSYIIFYMLRDIPLQPHYDFQQFCLAIIWRLIAQYTYIAGDTS
ncbi:hypothetical protein [Planktothrix agardhii]|uniref:hypothetical protein n=1 Tax=Planktothrix agardhii TaxID=1160 RepID=UPI0020A7D0C5|nr:hypothetical protein [Planktothrix agardhii]